jgi:hypothetical protein
MKSPVILGALLFCACESKPPTQNALEEILSSDSTINPDDTIVPGDSTITSPTAKRIAGRVVSGDFNGDGQQEEAYLVLEKEGHGNPVEDGEPRQYAIYFSSPDIPPIKIGCCDARLINEGDLNKDGTDELSIFQAPMNGKAYIMSTYVLQQDNWQEVMKPFLIPSAGDYFSNEELQNRVFVENDSLFIYDVDVNDKSFKLVKRFIR